MNIFECNGVFLSSIAFLEYCVKIVKTDLFIVTPKYFMIASMAQVICPVPWYNLRHQQYQPNSALGPHGYLLTSRRNIAGLARLGLFTNKAGVLRSRRSLKEHTADLQSEASDVAIRVRTDSLAIVTRDETLEITSDDSETSTNKTKVIDVLRNLFKAKAKTQREDRKRKRSLDEDEIPEEVLKGSEKEQNDVIESNEISGRSMVEMSVHLRLGQKTEKTRYALAYVARELECLEPFFGDSFLGGCCLKINPSDEVCTEHRSSRLFHCDFPCEHRLIACVVTKKMPGHEHQFLNMELVVKASDDSYKKVVLVGRDLPRGTEEDAAAELTNLYPLSDPNDPEFRRLQKYIVLNEPDFYVSVANSYGWKVRLVFNTVIIITQIHKKSYIFPPRKIPPRGQIF